MARTTLELPSVIHGHSKLGCENNVLASIAQNAAKEFFGIASIAINIGSVEKRNSKIQRLVHNTLRFRKVGTGTEIVTADPDQRYPQAGFSNVTH